jgi:hypothetical protein
MQRSYALPVGFGDTLTGELQTPLLLHDGDFQLERESRIRSNSYFVTIAVELENLSKQTDDIVTPKIEQLIDELLYAQERYEIIKKESRAGTTRRSLDPPHEHLD